MCIKTTFNFILFTIEHFSYLSKLCISDTTLPAQALDYRRVRLMQNCILYWASVELVFKSVILCIAETQLINLASVECDSQLQCSLMLDGKGIVIMVVSSS